MKRWRWAASQEAPAQGWVDGEAAYERDKFFRSLGVRGDGGGGSGGDGYGRLFNRLAPHSDDPSLFVVEV